MSADKLVFRYHAPFRAPTLTIRKFSIPRDEDHQKVSMKSYTGRRLIKLDHKIVKTD